MPEFVEALTLTKCNRFLCIGESALNDRSSVVGSKLKQVVGWKESRLWLDEVAEVDIRVGPHELADVSHTLIEGSNFSFASPVCEGHWHVVFLVFERIKMRGVHYNHINHDLLLAFDSRELQTLINS